MANELFSAKDARKLSKARQGLTCRQAEYIRMLAMGMSQGEVAALMGCSKHTVQRAQASEKGKRFLNALQEVADAEACKLSAMLVAINAIQGLQAHGPLDTVATPKRRRRSSKHPKAKGKEAA